MHGQGSVDYVFPTGSRQSLAIAEPLAVLSMPIPAWRLSNFQCCSRGYQLAMLVGSDMGCLVGKAIMSHGKGSADDRAR
jgi:hypothetical protein